MSNSHKDLMDFLNDKHSGLINYLFGKDRKKKINKEVFIKFQQDLMNDVAWVEFNSYSKGGKTISEGDFCDCLLLCSNITAKKKRQIVSRYMCTTLKHIIKV